MVHYGHAEQILNFRAKVLNEAFIKNPGRFKYKNPQPGKVPEAAWINKPNVEVVGQILQELAIAIWL